MYVENCNFADSSFATFDVKERSEEGKKGLSPHIGSQCRKGPLCYLLHRYTLRPRSINNANAARVVYLPLGHLRVKLPVYRMMSGPR